MGRMDGFFCTSFDAWKNSFKKNSVMPCPVNPIAKNVTNSSTPDSKSRKNASAKMTSF